MRVRTDRRRGEQGQAIPLLALFLVAIVATAGLLIDGGIGWVNRRQAQTAADLAALAAAKAIIAGRFACDASGAAAAQAAASEVGALNGFTSVTANYPATGTNGHDGCSYVSVNVSRPMTTTFSQIVGQRQWTAGASAVTQIIINYPAAGGVLCNFCSLNATNQNHTLLVQIGSTLIVDGEIYVNSSNGLKDGDPTSAVVLDDWEVGGDGFDIFGTGGRIEADYISVVGGWETHDNNIAVARNAKCPASQRPDPLAYTAMSPPLKSNVCIHQPVLADPLASFPVPVYTDYPTQSAGHLKLSGSHTYTLNPGVYVKGIEITGSANVILNPGVYIMAGGGINFDGSGSLIGNGVMIYNGPEIGKTGNAGKIDLDSNGQIVLNPMTTGQFAGMTLFTERLSHPEITILPTNATQCSSTAPVGQPQGCIGGLAGTIYAPHKDAVVTVKASGTANLQVISGKMLIQNGGVARFTYLPGFAYSPTPNYAYNLVE